MLCGDHALKSKIYVIDRLLLDAPNFLDPLENQIRLDVFKSKRGYIVDSLSQSFAIAELTCDELGHFQSCYSYVSFNKFVMAYHNANKSRFKSSFKINRKKHFKKDISKNKHDIQNLIKIRDGLEKDVYDLDIDDITNTLLQNDTNIFLAANRAIIEKQNNKFTIVDGTHRLAAYYWSHTILKHDILPNKLYAFIFEAS